MAYRRSRLWWWKYWKRRKKFYKKYHLKRHYYGRGKFYVCPNRRKYNPYDVTNLPKIHLKSGKTLYKLRNGKYRYFSSGSYVDLDLYDEEY